MYKLFAAALRIKFSPLWEKKKTATTWGIWCASRHLNVPVAKVNWHGCQEVGIFFYLGYEASLHCNKSFQLYEEGGAAAQKKFSKKVDRA